MKVLVLDHSYYYYPMGINSLLGFADFANKNYAKFIPLIQLNEEDCVEPYFIKEDYKHVFLNLALVNSINEAEITVLCKEEYDNRLESCVEKVCCDCIHYAEEFDEENTYGHRGKLSLDGKCMWKQVDEM